MNTLVEKGFGLLIFIGFFVPFTFGLYLSANKGNEFINVVSELNQMVKEDGTIKGSTISSKDKEKIYKEEFDLQMAKANMTKQEAHKIATEKLNASLLSKERNSSSAYNFLNSTSKGSNLSLVQQGYSMSVVKDNQEYLVNFDEWNALPAGTAKNNSDINKLNLKTGDKITVKYKFKKDLRFGWTPEFEREFALTIYKR